MQGLCSLMAIQHRDCKILTHNVRGINAPKKWNSLRNKIMDTKCDIVCLQEIKRGSFDCAYIRKFSPKSFDGFCFHPSVGSSGGTLTLWQSSKFSSEQLFDNYYAQTIHFNSKLTNQYWLLTNIYAPCTPNGKKEFLEWFSDIVITIDQLWMFLGDFNLIHTPEYCNKGGGSTQLMFEFNASVSKLSLHEIPLHGQAYNLSNMQLSPLLEKLDWCFVTQDWLDTFPETKA
jgi:exonuclease III